MSVQLRRVLFGFFVLSGFSGLLYQIVWVRMALASFGVITPFASVVVSVFMLGLALGTWWGARYTSRIADRLAISPIVVYGAAELVIGLSAFAVPPLFEIGRALLLPVGGMASGAYLLLSSIVIALSMLPFCICMGATFPAMMTFIERVETAPTGSFSFLYLANVVGAMAGAILTSVVLIETLGFERSLWLGACLNGVVALGSALIGRRQRRRAPPESGERGTATATAIEGKPGPLIGAALTRAILFLTGFASMALEIVWMRAFTPVLGTLVYAFSGLLSVYLLATWIGSFSYRRHRTRGRLLRVDSLIAALAISVMLPALAAIPPWLATLASWLMPLPGPLAELGVRSVMIPLVLLSILPFCALLGYLTPMLVDHASQDDPERAGRAYAINISGSILGPLAAAYILLPFFGARLAMAILALPFAGLLLRYAIMPGRLRRTAYALVGALTTAALIQTTWFGRSFEEGSHIRGAIVRRDHTATVISYGRGFDRLLLVNGYGMTVLTPLTKVMAHLPLASLGRRPESALVIAFGMGTTFRSLLSWQIDATAVELVPSVVDAFGYYHADAATIEANPRGEIIIDDGRRFLSRTDQRFDLITIDPPPPVETAGSSLLYAEEFYVIAKRRLTAGGILQQWFPDAQDVEPLIREAVLRAIVRSFEHIRVFRSLHGRGLHILASEEPIEVPDAETFVSRLPPSARRDLMEWAPRGDGARHYVQHEILDRELDREAILPGPDGPAITDDRPFNEYFILRRLLAWPEP